MDRTTRYLFIVLGIVVFVILAPLIVLYISGTRFNLESRDTTATGILVAKTVPTNAKVYVDGKEEDTTPATVRFLERGDYMVKLEKEGYLPWTKKLSVEPGKVTYTYEGVEAVELLKQPIPKTLATSSVTSMIVVDDVIWFSSGPIIFYADINSPEQTKNISLPIAPTSLTELRDSSFILAQNTAGKKVLINRSNEATYALPDSLTTATDFNITTNNFLLARRGDTLFSYNLTSKVLTPLLHQIAGFTLLGNTGYAAVREAQTTLQTMEWSSTQFTNAQPIANSQVPGKSDCQLIITDGKELFVVTDGNLYRANAPLALISSHIKNVSHDLATDELTFSTASELWFYNFTASNAQLLTRDTASANAYLIRSSIGYGFIGGNSGLMALEIDSRDQQNRYNLISGDPVWAIALSDNKKTAVALQNGQLLLLPIR